MTPANLWGGIAQLVERLVRNEKVRGSNPLTSTKFRLRHRAEGEAEAVGDDGFDDADHRHFQA